MIYNKYENIIIKDKQKIFIYSKRWITWLMDR